MMPKLKTDGNAPEAAKSGPVSVLPQRQKRSQDAVAQSRPIKRRKPSTSEAANPINSELLIDEEDDIVRSDDTRSRRAMNEPSKHFRFGSEDLEDPHTVPLQFESESINSMPEDDVDSDDEAPEDVSASTALQSARGAAAAAVDAADKQRLRLKEQRQEKDARRKAQAKNPSRKKPTKPVEIEPPSESDEDEPELLPRELLEHDFERAPTPPPQSEIPNATRKPKRKKLLLDQQPQETQAGPVKVRVLEMSNKFLAPKAVQRSKDRREHWLQGRSSGRGLNAFERRPMNARFV